MATVLRAVGAIDDTTLARHAATSRLETLEDVLHARYDVIEVIVQDEYTHDVVTRGRDGHYVVFDTT